MTRRTFGRWSMAAAFIVAGLAATADAQEAAPKPAPAEAANPPGLFVPIGKAEEPVKPLPLEPIPDDPPPHEGAMFELSYRIAPVDIILVEVLEALPGRPITGERLVRPDGTVTLGFYGDLHVAGLTADQVKTKLILHLRNYLPDTTPGLVLVDEPEMGTGAAVRPVEPPADLAQPEVLARPTTPPAPGENIEPKEAEKGGSNPPQAEPGKAAKAGESVVGRYFDRPGAPGQKRRYPHEPAALRIPPQQATAPQAPAASVPPFVPAGPDEDPVHPVPAAGRYTVVEPAISTRVFVDVSAYNSKIYYVLGGVGSPGRLTWTGNDTVLDALQYGGGLLAGADRHGIRLNRAARGGKPAKSYLIDLDAIERGETKANLQMFPGDRLIIPSMDGAQPAPRQRR